MLPCHNEYKNYIHITYIHIHIFIHIHIRLLLSIVRTQLNKKLQYTIIKYMYVNMLLHTKNIYKIRNCKPHRLKANFLANTVM